MKGIFKLLPLFILLSCSSHRDCKYQLPDWCSLKYNKTTKQYIINTGKYYSGYYTRETLHMIPPDVYFGTENNPLLYDKEWNSFHASLSEAYRYSDSCLAKGAIEHYIDEQHEINARDEIKEQEKRKRDSINNDFKPLYEDTSRTTVPIVKPNRNVPEKETSRTGFD